MIVLILERTAPSLRGELTRWLLEPRAGVFVGRVSARVRDRLWEKVCRSPSVGAAILLYTTNTEQGFALCVYGDPARELVEHEGLWLIRYPSSGDASPTDEQSIDQ
ncbi:MAG: type I-E CRISPR-associated endoribonuclease Cas2e [Thermomicrobium sp.]|nr:type I-E CRISPR-associated endoribonuclease Cas2e [Thermomicrobium sp.]MDW8006241.1 type I-E CRISPR-associated endoribonuclease Cas2e [Thermomicrobium sp.]